MAGRWSLRRLVSPPAVEPLDAEGLGNHDRLIFNSRGRRQVWRFRGSDGSWVTAQGRNRLRLDSGEALRDVAVAGLGIAFLPEFVVAQDVASGRLRRLLPDLDGGDAVITAIYPSRRLLEPRVRRFIDLLAEKLAR